MASPGLVNYFDSLQRCDLQKVNHEICQASLSHEQKILFKSEGVLVVDRIFNDEDISGAKVDFRRLQLLVEKDNLSFSDINLEASGGGWKGQHGNTVSHTGQIRKIMNIMDHGPGFKNLALHSSLLLIVSELLGHKFSLHSKGFLMNKPPQVSSKKAWHQDSAYFDTENEVITVWIPLQDVDEKNGCLHAIPGSHTWGKLPHVGNEAQLDPSKLPLHQSRPYPVKKGGICIMDQSTAHSSDVNVSSMERPALIFRFQRVAAEIQELLISHKHDRNIKDHQSTKSVSSIMVESPSRALNQDSEASGAVGAVPAVSHMLLEGERESTTEKRHLIIARVLRQFATENDIEFIDMGTDYMYPFYDSYKPVQDALESLKRNTAEVLHYPSSFGLKSLRQAFQRFMSTRFGVDLDWNREIMITTGASQAFDAMSRAFCGRYVAVPHLSLPTVGIIATANGAQLLRLPTNDKTGMIDLPHAQYELDKLPQGSVRFLYFNSPVNPTGKVANFTYLEQCVKFARNNQIVVLHDMDSWFTQHSGDERLHNILEVPGAMNCCITVLSVSKEFGLPGLRVGLLAGNSQVVNVVRVHNSIFAVMIPELCQLAAQAALESYCEEEEEGREAINAHVTTVLKNTVKGWKGLGWPDEAIHVPSGGFKYLVSIPPSIQSEGGFSGVELLDFYISTRANVKLSTSRSFNPENGGFLRMVLMQNPSTVDEVFNRFQDAGISYHMKLPAGLAQEYESFIFKHIANDF